MSNVLIPVHGSCHCGAITYEADVDPSRVTICHCTDCQALTGSAYRVSVPADALHFRLITGTPKLYIKVGDSGNRRVQGFCERCGSPLYTHAADETPPVTYGLRVGCLRERAALAPHRRIWARSALKWSIDLRGIDSQDKE